MRICMCAVRRGMGMNITLVIEVFGQ